LVVAQIILLSWWFSKKSPVKNTNQRDPVKTIESKSTCPKWHFGQVEHGGKKTIWGFFPTKVPGKKN